MGCYPDLARTSPGALTRNFRRSRTPENDILKEGQIYKAKSQDGHGLCDIRRRAKTSLIPGLGKRRGSNCSRGQHFHPSTCGKNEGAFCNAVPFSWHASWNCCRLFCYGCKLSLFPKSNTMLEIHVMHVEYSSLGHLRNQ